MTNEEFKCWISGYLTLSSEDFLVQHQINIIKNHAALVRAIVGDVDEKITAFISMMDDEVLLHSKISLSKLKQLASSLCVVWI